MKVYRVYIKINKTYSKNLFDHVIEGKTISLGQIGVSTKKNVIEDMKLLFGNKIYISEVEVDDKIKIKKNKITYVKEEGIYMSDTITDILDKIFEDDIEVSIYRMFENLDVGLLYELKDEYQKALDAIYFPYYAVEHDVFDYNYEMIMENVTSWGLSPLGNYSSVSLEHNYQTLFLIFIKSLEEIS